MFPNMMRIHIRDKDMVVDDGNVLNIFTAFTKCSSRVVKIFLIVVASTSQVNMRSFKFRYSSRTNNLSPTSTLTHQQKGD